MRPLFSLLGLFALLLIASIDEPPTDNPEAVKAEAVTMDAAGEEGEVILTSDFEDGDLGEWDLSVSGGACLGAPLCPDSNPVGDCEMPGCECVTECQTAWEPVCNMRAALCF